MLAKVKVFYEEFDPSSRCPPIHFGVDWGILPEVRAPV